MNREPSLLEPDDTPRRPRSHDEDEHARWLDTLKQRPYPDAPRDTLKPYSPGPLFPDLED